MGNGIVTDVLANSAAQSAAEHRGGIAIDQTCDAVSQDWISLTIDLVLDSCSDCERCSTHRQVGPGVADAVVAAGTDRDGDSDCPPTRMFPVTGVTVTAVGKLRLSVGTPKWSPRAGPPITASFAVRLLGTTIP